MSDRASAGLPSNHPLYAPGLKLRPRGDGTKRQMWIAGANDIRDGFRPKSVSFHPVTDQRLVAAECRRLQGELMGWRECPGGDLPPKAVAWRNKSAPPFPDLEAFNGEGHVYFLQCRGGDNRIKIGFATNPAERMRELMTGCPYPLALIAAHKGPQALEAYLHHHFRVERVHGEWFRPSGDLLICANNLRRFLERIRTKGRIKLARSPIRCEERGTRNDLAR